MMARLGLHGWMAFLGFYGGAALDLVVGLGLLLSRRMAILCAVQLLVMLVYTVLATIAAPSLWADPFGPLIKNAAIAGAALALFAASE
jgi:glycerol-3-phosphate acyltransferase PlsY